MEWNCYWSGNNVTPFLLYESSGDSEEISSDVHHHHHEEDLEAGMDESQGVLFRFNDDVDVDDDDDDDAQSCSYDHSSYINTSYGSTHHDQSQRLFYVDDINQRNIYVDDDDGDIYDDGDLYDDDDDKNRGESKLVMGSSKQQERSHTSCTNQTEIDRKFWEACLAS